MSNIARPDSDPVAAVGNLVSLLMLEPEDTQTFWNALPIDDLLTLRQINRWFRYMVDVHLAERYIALLGTMSNDPTRFRHEMRATGGVISGSMALLFIMPGAGSSSDVDIYVPRDIAETFSYFLTTYEGYHLTPTKTERQTFALSTLFLTQHTEQVVVFKNPTTGISINLIKSSHWNPLAYPPSNVENYLSADRIVCRHPLRSQAVINRLEIRDNAAICHKARDREQRKEVPAPSLAKVGLDGTLSKIILPSGMS